MPRHHVANCPSGAHRPPRAHLDPVLDAADALSLFDLAMHRPLRPEIIAILLDATGRGGTIVVVTEADDPDAVVSVVETMSLAAQADPGLCRLVVATVKPGSATQPGDIDRWLEASAVADVHGVELVEWFVIGPAGPECPRDLLGEPERW
ncbi:MAG: hypothetical protein HZB15_18005 [Actinobacteria bacterium]|nr:hypothetical protein [Actinomycetota bacterium]